MFVESHIEKHLRQQVTHKQSVSTGLFEAYQVTLDNGEKVFIKVQAKANQQLISEGRELDLLGKTIHTPKVLGSCEYCLILQWVDTVHNPKLQMQMGIELAKLHQNTAQYFGFELDNKIGKTPQPNAVNQKEYQQLLEIKTVLSDLLNNNIKPALLHGDLWSGNIISGENHPYFIDSASYYGHREIDFSLTFVFGGFSDAFYQSYNDTYPFDADFDKRKPLYMLYHYLNHLNIFGGGYHANVMNCYNVLHG